MSSLAEQAVRLGIELPDPQKLVQRVCEKCGKRHPARCRTSPLPDKQRVVNEIAVLEREQFKFGDDDGERDRLNEVRAIAQEQVFDDVYFVQDRVGRQWVVPLEYHENDGERMYPERTPDQRALIAGMAPFLLRLTPDQNTVVLLRYGSQKTEREIATILSKTQQAVHQQLERIHASVSRMMTDAFGGEEAP